MSTHWMNEIDSLIQPRDGEDMAEQVRRHDWASTILGPAESWPEALRVAVGMLLALPMPAILLWGQQQLIFHNDAFARLLGERSPRLLGASYPRDWPAEWKLAGPLHSMIMDRLSGIFPQQPLSVTRSGMSAQSLHSVSCSPVPDGKGAPAGMLLLLQDAGPDAAVQHPRPAAMLHAERMQLLDEVFSRSPSFVHLLAGPAYVIEFA